MSGGNRAGELVPARPVQNQPNSFAATSATRRP